MERLSKKTLLIFSIQTALNPCQNQIRGSKKGAHCFLNEYVYNMFLHYHIHLLTWSSIYQLESHTTAINCSAQPNLILERESFTVPKITRGVFPLDQFFCHSFVPRRTYDMHFHQLSKKWKQIQSTIDKSHEQNRAGLHHSSLQGKTYMRDFLRWSRTVHVPVRFAGRGSCEIQKKSSPIRNKRWRGSFHEN